MRPNIWLNPYHISYAFDIYQPRALHSFHAFACVLSCWPKQNVISIQLSSVNLSLSWGEEEMRLLNGFLRNFARNILVKKPLVLCEQVKKNIIVRLICLAHVNLFQDLNDESVLKSADYIYLYVQSCKDGRAFWWVRVKLMRW